MGDDDKRPFSALADVIIKIIRDVEELKQAMLKQLEVNTLMVEICCKEHGIDLEEIKEKIGLVNRQ